MATMKKDEIFFIINKINRELALSNYPQQILHTAMDILLEDMKIDACWAYLLDGENREPVLVASRELPVRLEKKLQEREVMNSFNSHIGAKERIVVDDLSRNKTFVPSTFARAGFASLAVVPLRTYHVQGILGVLSRSPNQFDRDYLSLLMTIGNLICAALDKANINQKLTNRLSEAEPNASYDIKEFENLATLAERYRQATHSAIKEAIIRVKGRESKDKITDGIRAVDLTEVPSADKPEPEKEETGGPTEAEVAAVHGDEVSDEISTEEVTPAGEIEMEEVSPADEIRRMEEVSLADEIEMEDFLSADEIRLEEVEPAGEAPVSEPASASPFKLHEQQMEVFVKRHHSSLKA